MDNQMLILLSSSNPESANTTVTLVLWGLIFFVAYFFLIRPQTRKAKMQRSFVEELEKGKWIVTNGGIHGKIVKVEDTTVTISLDNKVNIKIEKSSVSNELTKVSYPTTE